MPHKKKLLTTEATFWVQLICDCPTCGERIDLYDIFEDAESLPSPCTTEATDLHVECPGCAEKFIVNQVTW